MDEVDKAIEEFNKEIEKMAKESDKINDKFDDELKNTTNKATDDIKKHLEDRLKKENELDDRKFEARKKAIEIKKRMAENNEKRNDIKEKNIHLKDKAKEKGYSAYNEKEMKKRLKNYRIERAHKKRDLYGHDMNAKINPKLNGPQSLDSLYNHFSKEIKVKCGLIKLPNDAEKTYSKYTSMIQSITLFLPNGDKIGKDKESETIKNLIIRDGGVDSINQLKQKMIQDANKTFVKNYEDNKPFDRETKISEIPLQVIKWYAYNADDLKEQVKKRDNSFEKMMNIITAGIRRLEKNINNGVYEKNIMNILKLRM